MSQSLALTGKCRQRLLHTTKLAAQQKAETSDCALFHGLTVLLMTLKFELYVCLCHSKNDFANRQWRCDGYGCQYRGEEVGTHAQSHPDKVELQGFVRDDKRGMYTGRAGLLYGNFFQKMFDQSMISSHLHSFYFYFPRLLSDIQ